MIELVRLVLAIALLAACRVPVASVVIEPARAVEPVPVPVIGDLFEARPALAQHSRLDAVAVAAAQSAADDHVVAARVVREAMATQLGSGMAPHVLTGWGSDDEIAAQLDAALSELRRSTEISEIGVAKASGRAGHVGVVIAVPFPRLPITVERGADATKISMAWVWSDAPAAFAVTPTSSRRLEPVLVASNLDLDVAAALLDCSNPSAIEIRAGARVVATVVDACGGTASASENFGPPAATRIEIEQRVFELVNRERVASGRPALAWDGEAHRFARAHAEDMARYRYVSHEAPDGMHLPFRVEHAGFAASATRENVGHAWGPAEVHVAFMASPGHRTNLLAYDVDRGAVGVVADPRDPSAFYVTEFFRKP